MSISVLYTRVSSVDQKTDRQRVKEDDFDKVIEDKCSGAIPIFERPELQMEQKSKKRQTEVGI